MLWFLSCDQCSYYLSRFGQKHLLNAQNVNVNVNIRVQLNVKHNVGAGSFQCVCQTCHVCLDHGGSGAGLEPVPNRELIICISTASRKTCNRRKMCFCLEQRSTHVRGCRWGYDDQGPTKAFITANF